MARSILRMNNMRFSFKLPLLITVAAVITGGVVGYNALEKMNESANQAAEQQFKSFAHARAAHLQSYLESIVGNLHSLTDNPTTFDAMKQFRAVWNAMESGQTETLQAAYIHNNPNPLGKKNEMVAAEDGSEYSALHAKYHPWLNEFLTEMGLYDIFFISAEGDVIYTVYKELDFASNVKTGSGKDTSLGSLYSRAMELPSGSEAVIYEDFKPYAPSNNMPAAFIGRPVFGDDGERLGVVAFQMPIAKINDIMKSADGLGDSGELALYGADFMMRNDSRFEKTSTILVRKNRTQQIKEALAGKEGVIPHGHNFADKEVLAAYEPFAFEGINYAMIGEIDRSEIDAPIDAARNELLLNILLVLLGVSGTGLLVARSISKRINSLSQVIGKLSEGDTNVMLPEESSDEIGQTVKALENLRGVIANNIQLKLALDTCTSNVMMADANMNISYLNGAVASFLQEAEKDIQKELPRFSVATLLGSNIDVFHKNPSYQRGMLEKLSSTYKTSIQVGGRSFNLVANPIYGYNNERLGTVVEWQDGTAIGLTEAINKSQAIIEFQTDGTIINANANFLSVMGYALEEIKSKHHSMFVDAAYKASAEYQKFWESLNRGEAQTGEFKRIGKNDKEVWIQASYNPIIDLKGKVVRVVKTASDITQQVIVRMENERGAQEAMEVLDKISSGDLTLKLEQEYSGVFSEIKRAINSTVDKLKETVTNIKQTADSVGSAASQISSGTNDLSQRTEQQASSLEETAASMEEITGTVRANSENARNANLLSSEAREVAERGGQVVGDAVTAMNSIEKSSQKIADIITVIDEIAFQTNLLALNAAVEAARAGEAGKGFAVVASEVRSLAGRSASASKEIKALIMESNSQVKNGSELVNNAGETLKDIVTSVKKVADIIGEIASASAEQSTGIDEINSAVSQMDEMTQQNAALVEENNAAAQSLVHQAQELDEMMKFFVLAEEAKKAPAIQRPEIVKPVSAKAAKATSRAAQSPAVKKVQAMAKVNGAAAEREWEEF